MPQKENIRIVQLIDSLEPGGAERMAVNYANALSEQIAFSGLITTRKEGDLRESVKKEVSYFFLNKKNNLDLDSFKAFRTYCKQHKITHIHAHSSSFLWAVLIKFLTPNTKVIWHNHLGASNQLKGIYLFVLKLSSFFFDLNISVNPFLQEWANKELYSKKNIYLPNFAVVETQDANFSLLKGTADKRILCLANLRVEKNHFLILETAALLKETHPEWTFHLVGKDFNDAYSAQIKNEIVRLGLVQNVYVYGAQKNIAALIKEASFGVLTSFSEGLPVSLLEMGLLGKTVIATNVGDVKKVIVHKTTGILLENFDKMTFYAAVVHLIDNKEQKHQLETALKEHVLKQFSAKAIITQYIEELIF